MDFSHIPPSRVFRAFQAHDTQLKGMLSYQQGKDAVAEISAQDPTSPGIDDVMKEYDLKVTNTFLTLADFFRVLGFTEQLHEWRSLFYRVDTTHRGRLFASDFRLFFEKAGVDQPDDEVATFFETSQKNPATDSFNFDEFIALLAFSSPLVPQAEQLSEEKIEQLRTVYRRYDPDRKGFIAGEDLVRMLKELELEDNPEVVKQWLASAKGLGKVTMANFFELVGYSDEVALYRTAFMNADMNHTGLVEEDELAFLLRNLDIPKPEKTAKRVLKRRHSRKGLNFDQFVEFMVDFEHPE